MHKVDLITDNLNYLCTPRKTPFINVNDVTLQRTENKMAREKKRKSLCADGKEITGSGRDAGSRAQDTNCQGSFACPLPPLAA